MIRIVLDTNILVSALLRPESLPAQILSRVVEGAIEICVSPGVFAEYESVLSRSRFHFPPELTERALAGIRSVATWVEQTEPAHACADPDDDIFLDCAVAGGADYVVTGNLKDFPPAYGCVRVVSARWLVEQIS